MQSLICNKYIVLINTLYTLLVVCMGFSTVVEKFCGRSYVSEVIYGSWWFAALWGLTAAASMLYLVRKKVFRRFSVMLLHTSFVVILTGALTTRLTSSEGTLHLRQGEAASSFTDNSGAACPLPFSVILKDFEIVRYPGTDAVMDYKAHIVVDGTKEAMCISMNNIGKVSGYRFYQSSYDADGRGTVLLVASDPYGIAVTYTGYLLLLAGLILTMFSKQSRLRRLLRIAMRPALPVLVMFLSCGQARGGETVDKEIADEMAGIAVLYNGRICPLNTAATDFVTKLCGKSRWQGLSANEIFLSWTIFYTEWEDKRIIKVKDKEVRKLLGIEGRWACVRDFYTSQNEYKLKDKVSDVSLSESARKAIREADEKVQVITMFYNSELLRIFPLSNHAAIEWHKPGSTALPKDVGEAEFQFINHAMDHLVMSILSHDVKKAKDIIAKIRLYQKEKAGDILPSRAAMQAEMLYNRLQAAVWPVVASLLFSLLFCVMFFSPRPMSRTGVCHTVFNLSLTVYITVLAGLRWWISGHVPMSNGFETMLFMSWISMLLTLLLTSPFPVIKAFGPVVSSFCLLVAVLAGGSPQVTQLMPVLQSPLLAVHVFFVMMSYSIIAVMTLIAVRCLSLRRFTSEAERMTALSQLLLYPAVAFLAVGIFTGAVWANVSWGSYWSWDPKETWALITLMVYAVPLHQSSLWQSRKPQSYHWFVLLSFLSVLMTYFGVNHFLSGMHSYA